MKLKDKVAIVTGAGSGIGKAIAMLYAREGAKIVATDYNAQTVEETLNQIKAEGHEAISVVADVSKEEDIQNLVDKTVEKFGTVDILVNNAGIMDNLAPAGEVKDEVWDRVIAVNVTGVMRATRKVIPIFLQKQSGVIINVTSIAGISGGKTGAAYTTSKYAINGFTKNTGYMYALKGIRCNAIAPGGVETNIAASMSDVSKFGSERTQLGNGINPRYAKPEEIATIAVFLASDDSSFINGAIITADSGWTAY